MSIDDLHFDAGLAYRILIQELTDAYCAALDLKDWDLLRACFAPDAQISFFGGSQVFDSTEAFVSSYAAADMFLSTHHSTANRHVVVEGDKATGVINAVAFCELAVPGGGSQMRVRGLRFDDRYEQRDGRWVIVSRAHRAVWQFQADGLATALLGSTPRA